MVRINQETCTGCGLCANDCIADALCVENGKMNFLDPYQYCIYCGHCIAVCPTDSIRFDHSEYDNADISDVTLDDARLNPDQFLLALHARRSIRHYKPQKIEPAVFEKLFEIARYSPTGSNRQALSYIVVQDGIDELRADAYKSLYDLTVAWGDHIPAGREAYAARWVRMYHDFQADPVNYDTLFYHAPAMILFVAPIDDFSSGVNVGIAASNMETMAFSLGLGICYCGFLATAINENKAMREKYNIPNTHKVITSLMIGYPDIQYCRVPPRKKAKITYR